MRTCCAFSINFRALISCCNSLNCCMIFLLLCIFCCSWSYCFFSDSTSCWLTANFLSRSCLSFTACLYLSCASLTSLLLSKDKDESLSSMATNLFKRSFSKSVLLFCACFWVVCVLFSLLVVPCGSLPLFFVLALLFLPLPFLELFLLLLFSVWLTTTLLSLSLSVGSSPLTNGKVKTRHTIPTIEAVHSAM